MSQERLSSCIACARGKYSSEEGRASDCPACPAGAATYFQASAGTNCASANAEPIPIDDLDDFIATDLGQSACGGSYNGPFTYTSGSWPASIYLHSNGACYANTVVDGNTNTTSGVSPFCVYYAGEYNTNGSTKCISCQRGYAFDDSNSNSPQDQCSPSPAPARGCLPGQIKQADGSCGPCATGRYKGAYGDDEELCRSCPVRLLSFVTANKIWGATHSSCFFRIFA